MCPLGLCLLLGLASPAAGAEENLVTNPGFEEAGEKSLPAQWEPFVMGVPASFALDSSEKHSGRQSIRISAAESARSYIRSRPIPVVPGEAIRFSGWVKHKEVPSDKGTVIAIAEFTNPQGLAPEVAKLNVADTSKPGAGWQKIEGRVRAPEAAAFLQLRLGFSYAQGTCWWDDVYVGIGKPLVARIDLPTQRLSPAASAVPIAILNRGRHQGQVEVQLSVGKQSARTQVKLTAAPVQSVEVPVPLTDRGNKVPVEMSLWQDGKLLHKQSRQVEVPPPLVLLPLIPTHWAKEDGKPMIQCRVDLAMARDVMQSSTLEARLLDASGARHGTWSSQGKALVDGPNDFTLTAPELPEAEYTVEVELKPKTGKTLRAEQSLPVIPRRLGKVTLSPGGYPVYDGRLIFPLGIFNGGGRMEEAGRAGCTVSHAYNSVEAMSGGRPDDARAKDFLDRSHQAGMKALMLVPRNLAFHGDWDGVRRRVRMFRNHPGLLAWDEEEGLARGDIKLEVLKQLRDIVRQEDPNHPMMVGDARDVIGRIGADRANFFPVECMDLGMWWWYPLPLGGTGTSLEGDEGPRGTELVPPAFLVNSKTDKPLWAGVQSYKKPKEWARYPTPTEYRAQAYIALAHGAKGLMWYGGSVQGGMFLNLKEAHWEYLQTLAKELQGLAPALMGETLPAPRLTPSDAPLSLLFKRDRNRFVLIVMNRGNKPVEVACASPLLGDRPALVLGEDRSVTAAGGTLRDRFEPCAVHVYELGTHPK